MQALARLCGAKLCDIAVRVCRTDPENFSQSGFVKQILKNPEEGE
jgi:hypothetical protein